MEEEQNRYKAFRPSISVTRGQIFAIIVIITIIIAVPFIVGYVANPERKPISEIAENIIEYAKIDTTTDEEEWKVTLPLIHSEVNLTIFKQNPQLVLFAGVVFIIIAVILSITLIRNSLRK